MSVELALDINATCPGPNGTGTINVNVTLTNNGSQPVLGTASAFAISLIDQNANSVPGFTATGALSNLAQSVQPGASFGASLLFTAPSVQVGPIYTLICNFAATQDQSTQTFTFNQAAPAQTT